VRFCPFSIDVLHSSLAREKEDEWTFVTVVVDGSDHDTRWKIIVDRSMCWGKDILTTPPHHFVLLPPATSSSSSFHYHPQKLENNHFIMLICSRTGRCSGISLVTPSAGSWLK